MRVAETPMFNNTRTGSDILSCLHAQLFPELCPFYSIPHSWIRLLGSLSDTAIDVLIDQVTWSPSRRCHRRPEVCPLTGGPPPLPSARPASYAECARSSALWSQGVGDATRVSRSTANANSHRPENVQAPSVGASSLWERRLTTYIATLVRPHPVANVPVPGPALDLKSWGLLLDQAIYHPMLLARSPCQDWRTGCNHLAERTCRTLSRKGGTTGNGSRSCGRLQQTNHCRTVPPQARMRSDCLPMSPQCHGCCER